MAYNFTGLVNGTGNIVDFVTVINNATNEWLVLSILLTVFIILFVSMKNFETITALTSTSFIVTVIAVLFWILGFLSTGYMLIPAVLTMVFLAFNLIRN